MTKSWQDGQNDGLEAIRALQYEGTKAEIARNFKEQGNEMVKEKRWSDAKEFYTKGIAVLTDNTPHKYDRGEDVEAEMREERELEESIYANRALCNLELSMLPSLNFLSPSHPENPENYRSTIMDCAAALRVNSENIKAHYRSARALLALDKLQEAHDVCARGLKLQPSNQALANLLEQINTRVKAKHEKEKKLEAERLRVARENASLRSALKARGIRLRGSAKPPDLEDAVIRLSPDPLSPKSLLEFPTLFLYPLHSQTDLVKAFAEKDTILDHLSYLLPLPWDTGKEYSLETVDCYMDTISGGMMKVGKKLSLLDALKNGKSEIVDGLVRIHVVPSALAGQWIEDVKRRSKMKA